MTVLIYGATGVTGRLVARALLEAGFSVVLGGRDPHKLDALAAELSADLGAAAAGRIASRAAATNDAGALAGALAGVDLVVNCAGPFLALGEPVVRAAIEGGVHYFDTTGEQAFMRDIYERYESRARHAGVAVVNSFAFEVAIGDFAASLAAEALASAPAGGVAGEAPLEGAPIGEIAVAYAVRGMRPTRGTRLSALQALAEPGCVWRHERWEEIAPAAERRTVAFPAPFGLQTAVSFPSGEVITVPRHVRADVVQTYLAIGESSPLTRLAARGSAAVAPALPALLRSPLAGRLRSLVDAFGPAAGEDRERTGTRFAVVAEASRRFERTRVAVSGGDVYRLTGAIVAHGARALDRGEVTARGVLAPSELCAPEPALAALADEAGLAVERSR